MIIRRGKVIIDVDEFQKLLDICATITVVNDKNIELHARNNELEAIINSNPYLASFNKMFQENRIVKQSKINDE